MATSKRGSSNRSSNTYDKGTGSDSRNRGQDKKPLQRSNTLSFEPIYWNYAIDTCEPLAVKGRVMVLVRGSVLPGTIDIIFTDNSLDSRFDNKVAGIDMGPDNAVLHRSVKYYNKFCNKKTELLFVRLCNCRHYQKDLQGMTNILEKGALVEVYQKAGKYFGIVDSWGELRDNNLHEDIFVTVESVDLQEMKPKGKISKNIPIGCCSSDVRFLDASPSKTPQKSPPVEQSPKSRVVDNYIPPILNLDDYRLQHIIGEWKGIQGHYNSCYLDTTLFNMFLFTNTFDYTLGEADEPQENSLTAEIKSILRNEIIYPLRQTLFVSHDRVMKFRGLLQKLDQSLKGFETAQKDPEEFLEFLLQSALNSEPLLHLNSGQTSYCYQLFVEKSESLKLNTVQSLLCQSLLSTNTTILEVPDCLFLLMPRHGSAYKTYDKIFPSKTIDISDFMKDGAKMCGVCGEASVIICKECRANNRDPFVPAGFYCDVHCELAHRHSDRQSHKFENIVAPNIKTPIAHEMELYAIWCIETSHYISFARCGEFNNSNWYFFDSMANRIEQHGNGFNVSQVTECRELNEWLSKTGYINIVNNSKQIPEKVNRMLKDIYICMYIKKDV